MPELEGLKACDRTPRKCRWCGEELEPDIVRTDWTHQECAIRAVVGSVAHQERRCGCFVEGATEGDDPRLSKRENARLAAACFDAQQSEDA